jgi:predicted unusual protein kinase regulating ubiquinone biosynthesis (AarF/ABC1/UbiB family)
VVVKVQRPHIAERIAADLDILRVIARGLERLPNGDLMNPRGIIDDYAESLMAELDFRSEAANMDQFNAIMREHGLVDVAAPEPMHALTTPRMLVMERFFGARVDNVAAHSGTDDEAEAGLIRGLLAWFRGLLFHGFFHGDVHAGNLMVLDDKRIGFLDFGIVGRFPHERRLQVTDYLLALAAGNFEQVASVLLAMDNRESASVDYKRFVTDLREAYGPLVLEQSANLKYADLLPAMESVGRKHRLRLPREFVLLIKQMLYFDRYAKLLAPKLNIFSDPRIIGGLAVDVMRVRALVASETAEAAKREPPRTTSGFQSKSDSAMLKAQA